MKASATIDHANIVNSAAEIPFNYLGMDYGDYYLLSAAMLFHKQILLRPAYT